MSVTAIAWQIRGVKAVKARTQRPLVQPACSSSPAARWRFAEKGVYPSYSLKPRVTFLRQVSGVLTLDVNVSGKRIGHGILANHVQDRHIASLRGCRRIRKRRCFRTCDACRDGYRKECNADV